jgi:hypothetical protein
MVVNIASTQSRFVSHDRCPNFACHFLRLLIPRQCMELDLEEAAPDAAAQLRLREVLEDELGLEEAPEVRLAR